ncbi:DUF1249 domain-containing protein [Paraferrimonas sedimenticola]|uniref:DUF1249 domain-containing protein n=1 Tax=Paraferrimonas sedimenticola TaxID=375674 RepID=A0AA37RXX4_9GAMM|nr:DUF1249 domain-containing protein [Paraferrimonas sedimenticola]GLP97230.1 DUF1249 domain-containing protein [Paraferrimonas sedimenticola]
MSSSARRKYRPQLPQFLHVCRDNYFQLVKRLPLEWPEPASIELAHPTNPLELKLVQSARYTETLNLSQLGPALPGMPRFSMQIRLYHDAELAEVLSCQQFSRIKPVYDYPNVDMLQPDEKLQLNRFLAELIAQTPS